jgi:hypothetical protein
MVNPETGEVGVAGGRGVRGQMHSRALVSVCCLACMGVTVAEAS